MKAGWNRKSNLIQQTHVLLLFVQMALLGAEDGKEMEMNKAELLSGSSLLVEERRTKR